ncbi:monovalent cation:proton antiporter (CPA2 family) [Legionella busanensis]|uniref:Monovalent cation:proton antiporter (CPA2 family) n=1 Tax=Legionella busanensis TaxID=190655 RepID=A0A378JQH5_9GAMM|nr:cation:proton antiporter [Legionella busanensis]STX52429.1 monovalent cation:proton antiporter (CPA2 family) [Legionella busanensis]
MHPSLPLVTTLATALGFAVIMGFVAVKLKLPSLVGYLVAGMIIGPFTPGFVANSAIAAEFAEIGVMLLMFGVGLHFSVDNLLETRKIALPGAIIQIAVATILGASLASMWGWTLSSALVFGLALSVASTVVLIRALESQNMLETTKGQIAVGWLIVEDLAMILALVFLPFIAQVAGVGPQNNTNSSLVLVLSLALLKISGFVIGMFFIGRWALPKLLWQVTRTGSRELFTLCVIAAAVSIAFVAAKLFDISFALGAFFAGMIIRESRFSQRAAEDSLPFRDAFAVLFFVSVGMLVNPHVFLDQPVQILIVVMIIIIGKSIAAALLVLSFHYPLNTALTIAASLAQIGEFSFILASQGVLLKLLPPEGQSLILAGALISITLNPFLFKAIMPLTVWVKTKFPYLQAFESTKTPLMLPTLEPDKHLSKHIILVGYGKVGRKIAASLHEKNIPYVVIDQNRELVESLQKKKITAVPGDATDPTTLIRAHVAHAEMIVGASSDTFNMRQILHVAKEINPSIILVARVESEEEKNLLKGEIQGTFFLSEEELAKNMGKHILTVFNLNQ